MPESKEKSLLLRRVKCHSEFREQSTHIFGKKAESGVLADALVLRGSFRWNNQGHPTQTRACGSSKPTSSRRSDNDPPAALGSLRVHNRLEI